MVLFRAHSKLCIRQYQNLLSRLYLPFGLHVLIPVDKGFSISGNIIPDVYTLSSNPLIKERGELLIDGISYYIEILSVDTPNGRMPIRVKIWGIEGEHLTIKCIELLSNDGILSVRNQLVANMNADSIIHMVVNYAHELTGFGQSVSSEAVAAVGAFTPNYSNREYIQRINSLILGPDLEISIDSIISILYGADFDISNLYSLLGIVSGRLPRLPQMNQFQSEGSHTFLQGSSAETTITDSEQFFAITALTNIPFDHFTIHVNLESRYEITLIELNSMSGPLIPLVHTNLEAIINESCSEFLYRYFSLAYTDNFVSYSDNLDGHIYLIDKITLHRTMDEFLILTIYSGEQMYQKTFDLILLSIMSPVISNQS